MGCKIRVFAMKRLAPALVLATLPAWVGSIGQPAPVPTFVVEHPTVIAFFPHVTDAELERDADTNEALSDFQLYASQAGPRLKKAGIDFEVASATRFRVKMNGTVRTVETGKIGIGYYFIAPGRKPRVEYGVHDDQEILEIARQYFHLSVPER